LSEIPYGGYHGRRRLHPGGRDRQARRLHRALAVSVTTLGQFLDPLADKLLIAAALLALVGMGKVPAWVAMVIIGREIAVSVLRIVGLSQGVSIPAAASARLKT
jgi:phosphatidylglycerophosphate synthase